MIGQKESSVITNSSRYVKSIPLRNVNDVEKIKSEIQLGNIVICNISPLVKVNIDEVVKSVNELTDYIHKNEGDIARLGEERIVLTPKTIRIWRTPDP
jgi:SepF-like predicted cell division protein (DUF552 family)